MEPKNTDPMPATLKLIRQAASMSPSLTSLQEAVVKAISEQLPHYDWVGFYMLDPSDPEMLVLGPFVGEATPHIRIPVHQGICGAAAASRSTIVIDDVNADPRYLSCSINTRSEIVVPIFVQERIVGELDIDSHIPAAFTHADRSFL
jgi:GAF domain-containing protein